MGKYRVKARLFDFLAPGLGSRLFRLGRFVCSYGKYFFYQLALILLVLCMNGCAPQAVKPRKICPGKETVVESVEALSTLDGKIKPLRANGRCFAKFYDDKGKKHKEEFSIRLWLNPPEQLRLFGEFPFNARGLDIGSNESEFWVGLKPKEIGNSFFWGRWDEQGGAERLKLSPRILLEAFGIVDSGEQEGWLLSSQKGFDVLTKKKSERILKKIYVYNCNYKISRIEYFGEDNKAVFVVETAGYKEFFDGIIVPKEIKITSVGQKGKDESFRIILNSVKPYEFDEGRILNFFSRPKQPKGFKHIYRIVNGELIEQ